MKKMIKGLLAVAFCFQLSSVFAWGTIGHRVVAEIAERHLNKKAKRILEKSLDSKSWHIGQIGGLYQVGS
ncbi:hypothetical protein KUH03_37350 [Sphingobacterium sp. E70]|uniref:hypothetical protein n=1 Tax=Sphingobacterium sp. E70 TaxID=2853439 RepID=UPI00211BD940|nr:hypothetical protein [Sphingobacterium sp. E70]ULT24556.1 hypothetical protein KUH03_37350 [Sphingobacterium sp. E70]